MEGRGNLGNGEGRGREEKRLLLERALLRQWGKTDSAPELLIELPEFLLDFHTVWFVTNGRAVTGRCHTLKNTCFHAKRLCIMLFNKDIL